MTLLSQVFAIFVAAALLAFRARARGPSPSTRSTAVIVVVAVLTFISVSSFWGVWQGFRKDHRANEAVTPADAATRGGIGAGANVAFVEWLNTNLPPGESYLVSGNANDIGTYQWLTYRLYPRLATDGKARWIVFLRVTPEGAGFKRQQFSRVLEFAPDLALAEFRQ
jgi:hypothetical protein